MKAINIKWDTDGDVDLLKQLSTEIELPKDMTDVNEISDWLSDQTGFVHDGFELVY